jgi:hypothetical protein
MHSGSTLPSLIQLLVYYISIQSQLCYCQYRFLFKTSKTKHCLWHARNSTLQVAAWPHLETNETSTTWIKGWYNAVWMTRFMHILSFSDFLDRKPCCQPVVWILLTEHLQLHVWPDSCSRHCKCSHSHCVLCSFDMFEVETLRDCERSRV